MSSSKNRTPETKGKIVVNGFVSPFLDAWFVMLLLGAAHSADARVPAFGYWVTFALTYAVHMVARTAALSAVLAEQ